MMFDEFPWDSKEWINYFALFWCNKKIQSVLHVKYYKDTLKQFFVDTVAVYFLSA